MKYQLPTFRKHVGYLYNYCNLSSELELLKALCLNKIT